MKEILETLKRNIKQAWVKEELTGSDHPSLALKGYSEIIGFAKSASEIESFIRENYVEKEFVEWYKHDITFREAIVDDEKVWYIPDYSTTQEPTFYHSLNELHEYWVTNIKDK